MMRTLSLTASLLLLAACAPVDCPDGKVRAGNVCIVLDAGSLSELVTPEDAALDATPLDAAICDACGPVAAPKIQGTLSAAPKSVLWLWDTPAGASRTETRLDGKPITAANNRFAQELAPGDHKLEVRACDTSKCSDWASFITKVESFGESYGRGLYGTKRQFAQTPLKHAAAIACNDCALDAQHAPQPVVAALGKIGAALARDADVIDLSVALIQDKISVTGRDPAQSGTTATLDAILASTEVRAGTALISLEIVDAKTPAPQLADALLDVLAKYPELVRNGRPLLVRAERSKAHHLRTLTVRIQERLPLLAPYLRVWLEERAVSPIAPWQEELPAVLMGIDGVVLDFRADDLFGRMSILRKLGVGVAVAEVPGPGYGEVALAGLRQEVDLFFTDYRVDQARSIISDIAPGVYTSARTVTTGMTLAVHSWLADGAVSTVQHPLGGQAPNLVQWGAGFPLQGGVLDYAEGNRFVELRKSAVFQAPPFFSLVVRLANGSNTGTLVGSAGSGDALKLTVGGGLLRTSRYSPNQGILSTRVPGTLSDPPSCPKNGVHAGLLQDGRSYWVAGTASADGHYMVFIDGRCASADLSTLPINPPPQPSGQPLLLGAESVVDGGVQAGTTAAIQTAQVLSWRNHAADETN